VLLLAAVLGLLCLGWLAWVLFFPGPPTLAQDGTTQHTPGAQPGEPGEVSSASGTSAPSVLSTLPACVQNQQVEIHHATLSRAEAMGVLTLQLQGEEQIFRLAGILLPEDAAGAAQAQAWVRSMLEGETFFLIYDRGPNGPAEANQPPAAYVLTADRFLNADLLQRGLARIDPAAANAPCANVFLQAEQQARIDRAGIWQPTRVPTATFLPLVTLDPALLPPCDCARRPTCADFATRAEAQSCFNACNDYHSQLDIDRDGLACEELP
jgi:endonuclease YncB( thermonuclease family)